MGKPCIQSDTARVRKEGVVPYDAPSVNVLAESQNSEQLFSGDVIELGVSCGIGWQALTTHNRS
jgi:hypothetical protein